MHKQFDMGHLTAPKTVPKEIKMIKEEELPPPSSGGVVGGVPVVSLAVDGRRPRRRNRRTSVGCSSPSSSAASPQKPKPPAAPVRVGGNVQAANLIRQMKPSYPPLAKAGAIQGTVKFNAVIAKDGTIQNLSAGQRTTRCWCRPRWRRCSSGCTSRPCSTANRWK